MDQTRLRLLKSLLTEPGFWVVTGALILVTVPHYAVAMDYPPFLTRLVDGLGLQRSSFERILYMVPVLWAGFLFGRATAVVVSYVALAAMLPRAFMLPGSSLSAVLESLGVFVTGNLMVIPFDWLRKERDARKQLTFLNETSRSVSQMLDLTQMLKGSITSVTALMRADAALVFLVDEEEGDLVMSAHLGLSDRFVQSVRRLAMGEGLNGQVALTGKPLAVEDSRKHPGLTNMSVKEEGLVSQLISPLRSKGSIMGTVSVIMRRPRRFNNDEVEILLGIGHQIGVAVENARLYEKQRRFSDQLRTSEERYRNLFENAHDAIWVHDFDGRMVTANRAVSALTGYAVEELIQMNAADFLSDEGIGTARALRSRLLQGQMVDQPYEQQIIRKDGHKASVQITTSLLFADGRPTGFHHLARDVTEEKRMRENLRFYVAQVTRAQEEERKRIARDLHDETIQSLVVLARELDELASGDGEQLPRQLQRKLDDLRHETNSIMDGLRRLTQDLRPAALDRLGLLPALHWLASNIEKQSGIRVEIIVKGQERRLSAEAELLLFRIVQEALSNVYRHSRASRAEVILELQANMTRIVVQDNGMGFEVPHSVDDLARGGKLGLVGIRERARLLGASVSVESSPETGTTISVEAPDSRFTSDA